jgi:hypothetical protein
LIQPYRRAVTPLARGGQNVGVPAEPLLPPQDLRASDADRQRVADLLREHCAQGRLTLDEFDERLGQALAAKTLGQLQEPLHDLPVRFQPTAPVPTAESASVPRTAAPPVPSHQLFRGHVTTYTTVMAFLVIIWALTGGGYFWPIWPILGWGLPVALHGLNRGERHTGR